MFSSSPCILRILNGGNSYRRLWNLRQQTRTCFSVVNFTTPILTSIQKVPVKYLSTCQSTLRNITPLCLRSFGYIPSRSASTDGKYEHTTDAKLEELKRPTTLQEDGAESQDGNAKTPRMRINFAGREYKPCDLQTSIEYVESEAYSSVYGDKPVWFHFRRNFKGHFHPRRPRPKCTIQGKLISSNPCPVCRDDHLVLHHQHMKLLKQFIDNDSGEILPHKVTGICQKQLNVLMREVEIARDLGLLEVPLPFRYYDYRQYYSVRELEPLLSQLPWVGAEARIPHAQTVHKIEAQRVIERPRVPNRHTMEEMYKKVGVKLTKRRALETAAIKRGQRGQYPKMKAALERERKAQQLMSQ